MADPSLRRRGVLATAASVVATAGCLTDRSPTTATQSCTSDVDLSGAGLLRTDLSGADLSEADLGGTDLSEADLTDATLPEDEEHAIDGTAEPSEDDETAKPVIPDGDEQ